MGAGYVTARMEPAAVERLLKGREGPVVRDLLRRGQRVLNQARRLCPVDQGDLKRSLAMELRPERGGWAVRIGSNLEYAIYVHEGTGVYAGRGYIYPKRASVLRWPAKNQSGRGRRRYRGGRTDRYVYARRVRGVKARPFLRDALSVAG